MDFVSVSLCLLIGELRPFIFKMIIEKCLSIITIVLLIFDIVCVLGCTLCFNNYGFNILSTVSLLCSFSFLQPKILHLVSSLFRLGLLIRTLSKSWKFLLLQL